MILLLFADSKYFEVIFMGASIRQEAYIWQGASIRSFTILEYSTTLIVL